MEKKYDKKVLRLAKGMLWIATPQKKSKERNRNFFPYMVIHGNINKGKNKKFIFLYLVRVIWLKGYLKT